MNKFKKSIGLRLENIRRNVRPRVSREKLAEIIGVESRTIYRWEKGESLIPFDLAVEVAKVLKVHPSAFLGDVVGESREITVTQSGVELGERVGYVHEKTTPLDIPQSPEVEIARLKTETEHQQKHIERLEQEISRLRDDLSRVTERYYEERLRLHEEVSLAKADARLYKAIADCMETLDATESKFLKRLKDQDEKNTSAHASSRKTPSKP